ncbi:hypothetical protein ACVWVR_002155 [Ewingella americana]
MRKIRNFKVIDDLVGYDRKLNPQRLSVFDLLPIGLSWECDGKKHEFKHDDKIIALLLNDNDLIALIKAPFNKYKNQAYIINSDGSVKWDVRSLLKEYNNEVIFSDVYYIGQELYFFVNVNNSDFRFLFDVASGTVGKLLQSC